MKSHPIQSVNLVQELRTGRHYGVFIDDTGSPGLETPGLNAQRKSWVAVIVEPRHISEVMDQLPRAVSFLQEIGLEKSEFHFTDIWAGKHEFEKINLQQRLGIFRFMAYIFKEYRFQVLVQTFDPNNAAYIRNQANLPTTFGPLKPKNHSDLALIFVLARVRMHLQSLKDEATACVIVDEGRLASGKAITLSGLAPTFVAGSILFGNSKLVHPIQLADFAAFVLNRWQLLRVKKRPSELDKTFLEIVTPIAENFVNIDKVSVSEWLNQE